MIKEKKGGSERVSKKGGRGAMGRERKRERKKERKKGGEGKEKERRREGKGRREEGRKESINLRPTNSGHLAIWLLPITENAFAESMT